jgi:TonB family protein
MCSDELEGLSLLENPDEIDSIESNLNQKIDLNLANNNKTFWFSSPLRVAASIMVIVAISSLIYYTSTLTSTTTTLSDNLIPSEEENTMDSSTLETTTYKERLKGKKGENTKSEEHHFAEEEKESITYQSDETFEIIEETDDDIAVQEATSNEAAGANPPPTQPMKMAAKGAPQAAKSINIVEDDIDLFEEVTIMYETYEDSNKAVASYIAFSDEEEEFEEEEVFILVEEMPEFIHKDYKDFGEYIAKNLEYPKTAIESSIQGKVYISFIVEPDGSVSNVRVIKGIDQTLDEEAVRVVKSSPIWKPGTQRGKPVRVTYTFPVTFVLQ